MLAVQPRRRSVICAVRSRGTAAWISTCLEFAFARAGARASAWVRVCIYVSIEASRKEWVISNSASPLKRSADIRSANETATQNSCESTGSEQSAGSCRRGDPWRQTFAPQGGRFLSPAQRTGLRTGASLVSAVAAGRRVVRSTAHTVKLSARGGWTGRKDGGVSGDGCTGRGR